MNLKFSFFVFFFLYFLNIIFCQKNDDDSSDDGSEDINENSNVNEGIMKDCNDIKKLTDEINCCNVIFKINGNKFNYYTPIYNKLSSIKEYKKMLHDADDVTIKCSENYLSFYKIVILLLVFLF